MATHPPKIPTVFRNFCLSPFLTCGFAVFAIERDFSAPKSFGRAFLSSFSITHPNFAPMRLT